MENKSHKIFNKGECISEDMLLRYANDRLNAKEKHIVEKHTLGCDMCADALEGIMMMKDPSQLKGIVESLNKKIGGAGEERKPIVLWMDTRVRVAIAAGLALLIGLFFLFNNSLNKVSDDKTVSDNLKQNTEQDKNIVDKEKSIKADSTSASSDQQIAGGNETDTKTRDLEKSGEVTVNANSNAQAGPGSKTTGGVGGDKLENVPAGGLTKTDQAPPPQDLREQKQQDNFNDATTLDRSKSADKKTSTEKKPETIVDKDAKDQNGKDDESTVTGKITTVETTNTTPVQHSNNKGDDKYYAFKKTDAPKKEEKEQEESKGENRKDKKKQTENSESQTQPDEKNKSNNSGGSGYMSAPQSTSQNGSTSGTVSPNMVPQNNTNQDIVSLSNEVEKDTVKKVSLMMDSISYKSEISAGEKKYESKDYNQAVLIFTKTLQTNPNDREALYHLGDSYQQLNKPDLAIVQFDKLIKLGAGQYYDDARYAKATALIKQNKNAEAKLLLQDIEKTSTQYESRAKKSLDKIK